MKTMIGRVTYSRNFLKDLRKRAKTDYHNFTLPVATRSWIIENFLNLTQVNARSIHNKIKSFHQHISEQEVDICAITETWLRNKEDLATRQIPPEGYKVLSYLRQGRTRGGISLVHCNHITIMDIETNHPTLTTMETHYFTINIAASHIFLQIIYQFPNTSMIDFGNELADHFESHASNLTDKMLLVGDFNVHFDNPDTILLNDLLASYNLVNRINFPTHKLQHTLHLIIYNGDNSLITSTSRGLLISDHNFIHCTLNIKHPLPSPKTIQYRQIKKMDHTAFRDNLKKHLNLSEDQSFEDMISTYDSILTQTLDALAPVKTKTIKTMQVQPWFSATIKKEIRIRRMKEQKWRSDPNEYNYMTFYISEDNM